MLCFDNDNELEVSALKMRAAGSSETLLAFS